MAQTIKLFAHGANRGALRLWSWLLLAAFGLLTSLIGCRQEDIPVPVYGAPVVLYGPPFAGSTP
jgi:hypothetical protein